MNSQLLIVSPALWLQDAPLLVTGEAGSPTPPGPWDPSMYPGGAWAYHDAKVLASLWQDDAGTVPVVADFDDLCRVDDLSGNGRHLTQPDHRFHCDYEVAGFAGGPAIFGPGGGAGLVRTGGIVGAQTWAIAFRLSFAPFAPQALASLGGTHPGILLLSPTGGEAPEVGFAFSATSGTSALVGFSPGLDNTTLNHLVVTFDGTTYRAWWNGVEQTVTVTAATTATDATCGGLFARNDNSDRAAGPVSRIFWAAGAASGPDVAHLNDWLQG